MSGPVLSARSLGKRYGPRWALRDVSFAAGPGEMVAVIGPNGAGKTTLLSILGGVQPPSEGEVAVGVPGSTAGGPRADTGPGVGSNHRAETDAGTDGRVGWVPQQPALYSKLSVAENLRLFARLERVGDVEAAVARMLEQTGLQDRAGERLQRLSGGNRQRVNVALGLLSDPPAILLDEPSSALDPGQRERLWELVCDLAARGTCVLFSTHIVAEAARYAARVLVLDEGRLVFDGPPGRLAELGGGGDFEHAFVSFLRGREGGDVVRF